MNRITHRGRRRTKELTGIERIEGGRRRTKEPSEHKKSSFKYSIFYVDFFPHQIVITWNLSF